MPSHGFVGGYNVGLYSTIMEDSIFAPCPSGNKSETIRLYDALELGCILIFLS
ncbi:exostosin family protein [Polynucleobacter necessarius]|uniref:exostosin family protein n=1 Tax=Polynucleobacter necessarius TaxID=576610 RepID=UPI0013B05A95|nr:exostosin family protein [Polynucleobacter necessarius]